jgi:cell division protein FtsN
MDWWDGARDDSSERDLQLGMWLRGRLTVDPAQAELDFQRLVVLYPSSPYAPRALLRLAQSSHARGDADAAERYVATLRRDYPSSDARSEAQAWLSDAGAPPTPSTAGTPARTTSVRSAPSGSTPAQPAADSTRSTTSSPPQPTAVEASGTWFVQFGAFADEDRAFSLHQDLVDAGLVARLVSVQGSAFLHVRIGRFETRGEASTQLDRVRNLGYNAAIVRDDRPETMVRR